MTSSSQKDVELLDNEDQEIFPIRKLDENSLYKIFSHLDALSLIRAQYAYDPWTAVIDSVWKTRKKMDFSQITDNIILETGVSKTVIIEDILRRTNGQITEIFFDKFDEDCYVHGPSIALYCPSLKNNRATIWHPSLENETEEALLEELKSQKVYRVQKFFRRTKKCITAYPFILSFATTKLPKKVQIGKNRLSLRPYVPIPQRCYCCQSYGHISFNCPYSPKCGNCGSEDHTSNKNNPCQFPPKCVNCGGNHAAFHRACPAWAIERQVELLKITNNISEEEARMIVLCERELDLSDLEESDLEPVSFDSIWNGLAFLEEMIENILPKEYNDTKKVYDSISDLIHELSSLTV